MNTCDDIEYGTSNLNYSQMFFMTIGLLPFIFTIPCWIVAKYIFDPMIKEYESKFEEMVKLLHIPVPYEEKYGIKDISGNKLTKLNNVVIDTTPEGNVAMRYNSEEEAFEYWANKNISYRYLETVARKYANSFGCGSLYIDRMKLLGEKVSKLKKEIEKNKKKEEEEKSKEEEEKTKEAEEKNEDVFANLKNYKTGKDKSNVKTKITKNDIVCDQANKYIKKGKFEDYKEWMQSSNNKSDSENSKEGGFMSWLEWKNKARG